jgi:hypothetical protein
VSDDWTQVGTVELLALRLYPIDPHATGALHTEVAVEPGVYPVFRKYDAYRWVMRGKINERNEKIGDGLYALYGYDRPTGPEVEFSSPTFGAEQFAELLAEPVCQPGSQQRLRFTLSGGLVVSHTPKLREVQP